MKITKIEKKKKGKNNFKDSLRDLWDNTKFTNIHIIEVPEKEERKGQIIHLKK